MSHNRIAIDSTGKMVQLFSPQSGTDDHLAATLPAGQTLVTCEVPDMSGARPGSCWHYDAGTGALTLDEDHCAAEEARIKRENLKPLYQSRAAIAAAMAAHPFLDWTSDLALVDALIAAEVI